MADFPEAETGDEMATSKPTFPSNMTANDLLINQLLACLPGDRVYVSLGSFTDRAAVETALASQTALSTLLSSSFVELGELGEKAIKTDSKTAQLKTRHYTYPGKRTTTIEVYLAGVGSRQKDYLESSAFQGKEVVILVLSEDHDRAAVLNGLSWTFAWTGQDDAINALTISTEFAGVTQNRIVLLKDIPAGS
jgi:hypothetical protein